MGEEEAQVKADAKTVEETPQVITIEVPLAVTSVLGYITPLADEAAGTLKDVQIFAEAQIDIFTGTKEKEQLLFELEELRKAEEELQASEELLQKSEEEYQLLKKKLEGGDEEAAEEVPEDGGTGKEAVKIKQEEPVDEAETMLLGVVMFLVIIVCTALLFKPIVERFYDSRVGGEGDREGGEWGNYTSTTSTISPETEELQPETIK